jgi:sugar phosphate isomerase/epimerase
MNRRDFLLSAAAGATALSLPDSLAAANKTVGLQLYTLRNEIGKMGLDKVLEAAAQLGYKNIEMFGYSEGKYFGKTPAEVASMLKANGLVSKSGHYTSGRQKEMQAKGTLTDNWEKAVADAATVGHEYVICAYLFPSEQNEANYQTLPDLFNKAAETAKKAGLQFGYHNHDFEFTGRVGNQPAYDFILENTDKNLVKMELDLYWIVKAGADPLAYFKKHPGRFPLWHVKDMANTPQKEFAEVGTGTIDFGSLFKHRKTAGLRHYYVEQDVCKRPPLESVKISIDNIQKAKWG